MTETKLRTALRARTFTHGEVLAFAQFYHVHHGENSPENLLANYFHWKEISKEFSITARRLLIIESTVVDYYGLALEDVRGKRRYKELVRARRVIAYLTVLYATQSQINGVIGMNRNNVQFSKTKCGILMDTEKQLRNEVADITQRLAPKLSELIAEETKVAIQTTTQNEDETRQT
jgi:chromosomal replication initiation ATPase DnaA